MKTGPDSRRFCVSIMAVLCLLLAPAPGWAQRDGRIRGSVRDQQGAVVQGAKVTVINQRTGEERTATSNDEGFFVVTTLPASTYLIRVEVEGFAPIEYPDMPLSANQELPLDFELQTKGVTETVTVMAASPVVDLSSARMGTNVVEREVKDLPINGRQLSQLYLQAPGSLNSGTGTFSDIRFSGRAVEQNAVRFDGIEGSAIIDSSPGNLNGEIPSPFRLQSSLENVQEFRVESNSYPAEYGTGTGGQVAVVTKSGSNVVHGSIFGYKRSDNFDSPNFFDINKSPLDLKQFGGSLGAPIVKNKTFFFASYEGYRLDAGINFVEAVPSAAAAARAVPAIQPLIAAFRGPGAVVLPGASTNPDFDILQLQGVSTVKEDAFSLRLDHKFNSSWSMYGRYFSDRGTNSQPEGVTGRTQEFISKPQNGVFALQGIISATTLNEAKIGYNRADSDINGLAPTVNGIDLSNLILNLSGSVANTGIAGQGSASGIAIPGGLLRQNSASNGRGAPYRPYTVSFVDTLTVVRGNHSTKFGGEYRMVRIATDRLGGTTYTFSNLNGFLANQAQQVAYLGDLSEPSVFNNGATGQRHAQQEYFVAYAQDEWRLKPSFTLNYGLRYDYYTPLRERDDLNVQFDTNNGVLLPSSQSLFQSKKNNFQPRVSFSWAPGSASTVLRGGFGMYVGPGQTEDQIQPIESDRIATTITGGAFPVDPAILRANFANNPNNRAYQPRAYSPDYTIPERVYSYTLSVQRELPYSMVTTVAYVGSQGRNLFLRNFSNRIVGVQTNPDPTKAGIITREFDIVGADGSIQRPFAEVDFKTSGGHDNYNALQLQLQRRFNTGLTLNSQYTLGRSFGNTGGSNEALTAGNPFNYDYDLGYNQFDVRHTFNLSALYSLPFGRGRHFMSDPGTFAQAVFGGWDVGAILNARSGVPVDVRVVRPDVVYVNAAGEVFNSPAAGLSAVINTPGGGASRNVRRPNLIPGVDPYIEADGLLFLNPEAFSIPAPGEFGNLQRGALRGPNFRQMDMLLSKRFSFMDRSNVEFRVEIFNLFNTNNFANPVGTLPNALGTGTNQIQPNQPFTSAAAGTFGKLTSTVGRTVGLGTNRQVQFALRFNF